MDEAESLYLQICKGIDDMDKQTLNHYRIVTPDRRNQTETPELKSEGLRFTG